MVDLTHDRLEKFFEHSKEKEFKLDQETPCSYGEYCKKRSAFVTEETLENYRIVDSSEKLLKRFGEGTKQVTRRIPGKRCGRGSGVATENGSDVTGTGI